MILVIRIAGRANNRTKEDETLKRLNLDRKFAAIILDPKDSVRKGMVASVQHMVAFGKISAEFMKELQSKRPAKDAIYHLHPPRGGFKKSSKVAAPQGILGRHEDLSLLARRML